jgi:enoyl-CoA hydratase/carnithine racemase
VIAAANGPAVGIGVTMQLPMDIRIASTDARFGFLFARRGILPEACSSWFLPRIVGVSKALEWNLSGRVFSAEEALASRLVSAVHTPAELIPAARTLAREIADNTAPVSVALTRKMRVAQAWRRPSDGGAQDREPCDIRPRRQRRPARRRDFVPRETGAAVHRPGLARHARLLPWWRERRYE